MDYNSDRLSNLGRQATFFLIHRLLNFWLQHLLNSLLSNINEDGDNNEKTKNLKIWWEWLKTWVGIFQVGIFWVGIFRGGVDFPGGVWWVGIFRVGVFLIPCTNADIKILQYILLQILLINRYTILRNSHFRYAKCLFTNIQKQCNALRIYESMTKGLFC